MILPRLSESLAGRMEIVPLFPFSCGELVGVSESFIRRLFVDDISKGKPKGPDMTVVERVVRGGYPQALERAGTVKALSLVRILYFDVAAARRARFGAGRCAARAAESFTAPRGAYRRIIQYVRYRPRCALAALNVDAVPGVARGAVSHPTIAGVVCQFRQASSQSSQASCRR